MKKSNSRVLCAVMMAALLAFSLGTVTFGANSVIREGKDAVSTAEEAIEDAVTKVSEALDPESETGESDKADDSTHRDTTNERPAVDNNDEGSAQSTVRPSEDRPEEETSVQNGDSVPENEEGRINPWAVAIAVVAVIAVLVLIFVLIPKRR